MRSVQDQLAAAPAGVGPVPPLDLALHDAVGCILTAEVAAHAALEGDAAVPPGDRARRVVLEG